jgi:hypothetical protein
MRVKPKLQANPSIQRTVQQALKKKVCITAPIFSRVEGHFGAAFILRV